MNSPLIDDQFHKDLIDNLYDGVYFVDTERRVTYWNKGAERITGYMSDQMLGRFCHANILDHVTDTGQHLCSDGCPLMKTIQDGHLRETEVLLRHAEGHRVPVLVRTSPIYNEQKQVVGAVEVFSNNQSLFKMRQRVDQLEQDVLKDTLTGLGNRAFLKIKIADAMHEFEWNKVPFGLLFMDIDRFKSINDTYGHPAGDLALQATAQNLVRHLRSSDVCGRWGGEEFIALLYNVKREQVGQVADKVRAMIEASVVAADGMQIPITISVGAAVVHDTDTPESLIQRADELMYKSKKFGRNRVTMED